MPNEFFDKEGSGQKKRQIEMIFENIVWIFQLKTLKARVDIFYPIQFSTPLLLIVLFSAARVIVLASVQETESTT